MAFYRNTLQYGDISQAWQKLHSTLSAHPDVKQIVSDDPDRVCFFINNPYEMLSHDPIHSAYMPVMLAGFTQIVPVYNSAIVVLRRDTDKSETVSKTHIRLPKLSHLITLTPDDFFLLLNIIDTAKVTQQGNSLSLQLAKAGVHSLNDTNLAQFFTPLITNHRINRDLADRKWTPLKAISQMAAFPPYAENQLYAMQYFTVLQNDDVFWLPEETAVNLELDPIEFMTKGYCKARPDQWVLW